MYDLNIDIKILLPYIIDAYTHVFGEKYRNIISERVNKTVIVYYTDYRQISNYLYHLKRCKINEFKIRFLEEIGYDTSKYNKDSYTENLPKELEDIISSLTDNIFFLDGSEDYWCKIKAFDINNKEKKYRIIDNKIALINYLLSDSNKIITKENYYSFKRTKKYQELLIKINKILETYNNLKEEYKKWKIELHEQENFVKEEEIRKDDILNKKREEAYLKIYDRIPSFVKKRISKKPLEEQIKIINDHSYFESFSPDTLKLLMDPNDEYFKKIGIVFNQRDILKRIGVRVLPYETDTKAMIEHHIEFITQERFIKCFPSKELCNEWKRLSKKASNDAFKEYTKTRDDIINAQKWFDDGLKKRVYNCIKDQLVCILGEGGHSSNNVFVSIMIFSKRDYGYLAYDLLHEFGHVISQAGCNKIGLDVIDSQINGFKMNPYNKKNRLHERINETFDDIFSIEANEYLRSKGIYLIEDKEVNYLDASNRNTREITKNLLVPLINKFRPQIVKAILNADPSEYIKYIGEENYNELNDIVNRVDDALARGVEEKIKNKSNCRLVKEYNYQFERIKQVYENIDNYYSNNFGKNKVKSKKIGSKN